MPTQTQASHASQAGNITHSTYITVVSDGEILSGELPRKQLRLVPAWIEIRRDELMADWDLAVSGETPYKISPL